MRDIVQSVFLMQFTPQQLAGGHKYSSRTRIGNWQEDRALEESKQANFERRANSGNLSIKRQQSKLLKCTEAVPHTYSHDGLIRFGDSIMLRHDMTGAILACDIFNTIEPGVERYIVSGSLGNAQPVARNVFRILRPPVHLRGMEDDDDDDILRVGQAFCIGCNQSLLVDPGKSVLSPTLYLCSIKKNERTATRRSNKQSVFLSPKNDADSVWLAVFPSKGHKNTAQRYLSVGQPSSVQNSLQITHRQTNMYLSCDPASKEMSEFGIELECFADRSVSAGKLHLISSEFNGHSTAQTLEKSDSPNYAWHFVASGDESTSADTRRLPPFATPQVLIIQMHDYIMAKGFDGFWELRAYFEHIADQLRVSMGKFNREDFKEALIDWGCPYDSKYLDTVIDIIDPKHLGVIDYKEFLDLIRGGMSEYRLAILNYIFDSLDPEHIGRLSIDYVSDRFDGESHPYVTQKNLVRDDALQHFLQSLISNGRMPQAVTYEAFYSYFSDLSASLEDTGYFESIVRNLWQL